MDGTLSGGIWSYTIQNVGRGTFVGAPVQVNIDGHDVMFLEESETETRWFMRRAMNDSSVQYCLIHLLSMRSFTTPRRISTTLTFDDLWCVRNGALSVDNGSRDDNNPVRAQITS